ncbi:MAG: hypothetical protein JSS89_10060 [Bacteroidetes bacterium]|nr:hypothetical protein [Bacteroidota bacterium]
MDGKKILAIIIAVLVAWMIFKVLMWTLFHLFTLMWFGFKVIIMMIIAIPIYLLVKNWLTRR